MPTCQNQMQVKCKLVFTERANQLAVLVPSILALVFCWKILFGDQIHDCNCTNESCNIRKSLNICHITLNIMT